MCDLGERLERHLSVKNECSAGDGMSLCWIDKGEVDGRNLWVDERKEGICLIVGTTSLERSELKLRTRTSIGLGSYGSKRKRKKEKKRELLSFGMGKS